MTIIVIHHLRGKVGGVFIKELHDSLKLAYTSALSWNAFFLYNHADQIMILRGA